MKRNRARRQIAALGIALACAGSAQAQTGAAALSVAELIEAAAVENGRPVVITGEAIGQALPRGGMAWINVADSSGAIGLWMNAADAAAVTAFGSYRQRGDTLRVSGIFYRACAEHGGDADVHAETVEIIAPGGETTHPVHAWKIGAAGVLVLAASLSLAARFSKTRRRDIVDRAG